MSLIDNVGIFPKVEGESPQVVISITTSGKMPSLALIQKREYIPAKLFPRSRMAHIDVPNFAGHIDHSHFYGE